MMRLDKYLSDATAYSRREIRNLVKRKAITVNGSTAQNADMKINEALDAVCVNGEKVFYRKFIYLMLNKPQGYLSATEDDRDPVVVDLLPEDLKHFAPFPVGRLDKDTEGLLLLTNDGQFDHAVTSPVKNVVKRYFARLDRPAEMKDIATFRAGMDLGDFVAKPAGLEITENPCEVFVEVSEGKFHQVKRMCEKVGKKVIYLKRLSIGSVVLDPALESGAVRELTAEEIKSFTN